MQLNSPAKRSRQTMWSKVTTSNWITYAIALMLTSAVLIPIGVLLIDSLTPDIALWQRLWNTILPDVLWNTVRLMIGVGLGTFLIGTFFAWLISTYEFPGRRWFEQLLLLPMAVPGFIMGFVYVTIFEFAGPVQTALRDWVGWSRGEYWFPNIASPTGLIIVLTLVLYPYVYILARAAFREQAKSTLEAAQVMGLSTWQSFLRVALPMARPQIAAGVLLVIMEAMTDYGTVSYFSYPTLSERIIVLWSTSFDISAAIQLASLMVVIALILLSIERQMRGQAQYYQQGGYGRTIARKRLSGSSAWLSSFACLSLLSVAFILPVGQLVVWTINELNQPTVNLLSDSLFDYTRNSFMLASVSAILIMFLALITAYTTRNKSTESNRLPRSLARLTTIGYAMPGAVIGAGVLTVINPIDGAVTDFATQYLGWTNPSYLLTGTMIALTYAYIVRFMSIGFNSVDASLGKIKPNMEGAARTMGTGGWQMLQKIYFPLSRVGIIAGMILVFVDIMKELPMTLLLRPFGVDTLALRTYFLSIEGWHESAAIPALMIVLVGLIPVFILVRLGGQENNAS
ncbi:MAG: iron ABC transporter permease [Chloroflexota bacterium]